MKLKMWMSAAALILMMGAGSAFAGGAQPDLDRDQSDVAKMFHKLGRGIVNGLTSWVEIPRNIAIEWEKTDPATGIVLGSVKGIGWCFTRFATGVYETFTFPFPIPQGYVAMMEPEFVVTDVWGDGIPELTDFDTGGDPPMGDSRTKTYPERYKF